jgi:hypothetical protein
MSLALLPAASLPNDTLYQAADMLCQQWGGNPKLRVQKMIEDKQRKCMIISDLMNGSILGYAELEASSTMRNISHVQISSATGKS